jgi:type II secretion system protein J
MKPLPVRKPAGFTLIEIMMAMAIFGLVMAAIYSTWMLIVRGSKVGLEVAARAQRERVAIQTIEQALNAARSFQGDLQHYGFYGLNDNGGVLTFVARLPKSFPRSGRFGDFDVRRVAFSVESGRDNVRNLVLRQAPILTDFDQDEMDHPLVLAKDVKELELAFWDVRLNDWVDSWQDNQTNSLPRMVRVTLRMNTPPGRSGAVEPEEIMRIVALPSIAVPVAWQRPGPGGPGTAPLPGPGTPGQPIQPIQPGQPGQPGPPIRQLR